MPNITSSPVATPNTIMLRVNSIGEKYSEGRCKTGKTIVPGMLIEKTVDTGYPYHTLQPHATADGIARLLVAIELALVADVPGLAYSGGTIDDSYGAGDLVRYHLCMPGDVMFMLVAASAVAIIETDFLSSAGDGTLKKSAGAGKLFQSDTTINNSGNALTRARIRAEALGPNA